MKKEFKIGDLIRFPNGRDARTLGPLGLILSISNTGCKLYIKVYWFNLKKIHEENPDWIEKLKRDQ